MQTTKTRRHEENQNHFFFVFSCLRGCLSLEVDRDLVGAYGSVHAKPLTLDHLRRGLRCAVVLFRRAACRGEDGASLYKQLCSSCHDTGLDRAPDREALRGMSSERVLTALESGVMLSMASRPHRRGTPRHRRIRHGQTLRAGPQRRSVPAVHVPRDGRSPRRRSIGWPALERVGREHDERALSGWCDGRIHRGRGTSSAAQMGFRFSGRAQFRFTTDGCRRTRVRRYTERHRLFAERRHRLRPLVFPGSLRRACGHQHWPHRNKFGTTLRRVYR